MKKGGYIVLTVFFSQEKNNIWLGRCKELGTSTFGNSLRDAQSKIFEAIELHLDTLVDVGEMDRFFEENNIQIFYKKPVKEISLEASTKPTVFTQPYIRNLEGALC